MLAVPREEHMEKLWEAYYPHPFEEPREKMLNLIVSCLDYLKSDMNRVAFKHAIKHAEPVDIKEMVNSLIRNANRYGIRPTFNILYSRDYALKALIQRLEVKTPEWNIAFEQIIRECLVTKNKRLYQELEYSEVAYLHEAVRSSLSSLVREELAKLPADNYTELTWLYTITIEKCTTQPVETKKNKLRSGVSRVRNALKSKKTKIHM